MRFTGTSPTDRMKIFVALSVLLTVSSAKILSRCELARIVKNSILAEFPKYSVADWVCMAHYESRYNTLAKYYERGSIGEIQSGDYGIFQISSKWWCRDAMFPNSPNGCNMNCNLFLHNDANIEADISCAAIIANQQGMEAWQGWAANCKGKWIDYFTYFCFW